MGSQGQPIKIWGRGGPNPPKVALVSVLLDIPHEFMPIRFTEVKRPEYLAINPNGRVPAIYDPSTDITLWESGAIIEYLIDTYDKDHKISFAAGTPEYYHARQWLYFQVSGQGPYYGQASWFVRFHPENVPSAIARYIKELHRVSGVLQSHLDLQRQKYGTDAPWLVGNKFSYADVAFAPWQVIIPHVFTEEQYDPTTYPLVKEWIDRIMSKPGLRAVMDASVGEKEKVEVDGKEI